MFGGRGNFAKGKKGSWGSGAWQPFCVLGPAGSGKSTALEVAIRRAAEAGAHVGIACPTGMLASAYREKFPGLDVADLGQHGEL